MERVTTFLGKHLWLQIGLSLLVAFAVVLLLAPNHSAASALLYVAVGTVGGFAFALPVRRREKRAAAGSVEGLRSLDRRLRRGEVPTAPEERQAMRGLVAHRLHRTRHRVAAQIFLAVLCGTVVVLTALTAGPWQTTGFAAFSAAFLAWIVLYGNLQNRRLRTMGAALTADAPREGRR